MASVIAANLNVQTQPINAGFIGVDLNVGQTHVDFSAQLGDLATSSELSEVKGLVENSLKRVRICEDNYDHNSEYIHNEVILKQTLDPLADAQAARFGSCVAVDKKKNILVVGARAYTGTETKQGAIYVYVRDDTDWKLSDGQTMPIVKPDGVIATEEFFGDCAVISSDGSTIAATVEESGVLNVIVMRSDDPDNPDYKFVQRFTRTIGVYTGAMALNADGTMLFIGETSRGIEIYNLVEGVWVFFQDLVITRDPDAIAINELGDILSVVNKGFDEMTIYENQSGTEFKQTFLDTSAAGGGFFQTTNVSEYGKRIIAREKTGGNQAALSYYKRGSHGKWLKETSVLVHSLLVATATPQIIAMANDASVLYMTDGADLGWFHRVNDVWIESDVVIAAPGGVSNFGRGMTTSGFGHHIVVSDDNQALGGTASGRVYIYEMNNTVVSGESEVSTRVGSNKRLRVSNTAVTSVGVPFDTDTGITFSASGATPLNYFESETLALTWGGAIANKVEPANVTRIGNVVTITFEVLVEALTSSNSISLVTALDAKYRPTDIINGSIFVHDNGVDVLGKFVVSTGGVVSLFVGVGVAFGGVGNGGFPSFTASWVV